MEVVGSDGYDLYDFLLNIAEYVIGCGIAGRRNDWFPGRTETGDYPFERGAVDGFSLKIDYC